MRAPVLPFCSLLLLQPLAAQCLPQQASQLYHEAVNLLTGGDSSSIDTRWVFDLPRVDSARIQIVTDTVLCRKAADLYAKYEGIPEDLRHKPLAATFAVVQADSLLLIEHSSTAGHRGCCWLVLVVDLAGKRRYGYAEGL